MKYVAVFFAFSSLLLSGPASANPTKEEQAPAAPAAGQAAPAVTSAKAQSVPNQRELSEEDYAFLGRKVWDYLQQKADPAKPTLSEADIQAMIDDMQRNRGEVSLNLDELNALMNSPAFCKNNKQEAFGMDLDGPHNPFRNLFK